MTREFKKGDPDLFDLAWLDHEELQKFQEAMLSYSANDICRYWLHCLNEQAAIRSGKLRVIPGAEGRDPDFKQYTVTDIHAAQLILGALESQFQATGKPTAQDLCTRLLQCCRDALVERQRRSSYSAKDSHDAIAKNDAAVAPPLGICSHCHEYTLTAEQMDQKCATCRNGFYVPRRRKQDWLPCSNCKGTGLAASGHMRECFLCCGCGWAARAMD